MAIKFALTGLLFMFFGILVIGVVGKWPGAAIGVPVLVITVSGVAMFFGGVLAEIWL